MYLGEALHDRLLVHLDRLLVLSFPIELVAALLVVQCRHLKLAAQDRETVLENDVEEGGNCSNLLRLCRSMVARAEVPN